MGKYPPLTTAPAGWRQPPQNHALRGGWLRVRGNLLNSLPIHYRTVISNLPSPTCPPSFVGNVSRLPAGRLITSAQGALYLPRATPQIIAESLPLPIIGSHEYRRLLQSTTTLSIVPTHTPPPTPRLLEECYTPSWLPAGRNEPPRGTSLPRATPQTLGGAPHVMSNGYSLLFCCNLRLRHLHAP